MVMANGAIGLIEEGEIADATSVLDQIPFSTARTAVIDKLAAAKGKANLDGAFDWAKGLPPGEEQTSAYSSLMLEVGAQRARPVQLTSRLPAIRSR